MWDRVRLSAVLFAAGSAVALGQTDKQKLIEWAGSWVKDAELGDLVPAPGPTVQYQAAMALPRALVTPIVNVNVTTRTTRPPTQVAGQSTQAQTLLTSQSPAEVIVGARLERTRIVGVSGGASETRFRFNPQARPPLRFSR